MVLCARGSSVDVVCRCQPSGFPEEDAVYKDVVVFAKAEDLVATAVALLGDPKRRLELSVRGVEFMAQEQTEIRRHEAGPIRSSALALLSDAIATARGK